MKNIIVEFAPQDHAIINYTNWEGITADRRIQPLHIWFGVTEYHKAPQFLLHAIDLDKDAERDFAMNDIHKIDVFYNPMSREEWFYHPSSPQKEFFFTHRSGDSMIERSVEPPYNPVSQMPDFWFNILKNSKSELVQEDYAFDPDLLKEIKETLQVSLDVIGKGDFELGCCCCGSPCESHGFGDGHSPVDAGTYYNQILPMRRIEELLAKLTSE